MPRMSPFDSPLLLGFEEFAQAFERIARASSDGYPPYNVEQMAPGRIRITVAVAGFAAGELSVTVENNELVVDGNQADSGDRAFLHRGIAARRFQRRFVLADGIRVTGAALDKGLLHVDLEQPESSGVARRIEIRTVAD